MRIKAETRDIKALRRSVFAITAVLLIYLTFMIGSIVLAEKMQGVFTVLTLLSIVLLIPVIIITARVAAGIYNKTWTTGEFDLHIVDNHLYYGDKKLHVINNSSKDLLYVHDLGENKNPQEASVYLTVEGEDKDRLLAYLKDYGIKTEEESSPRGKGKHGTVTEMGLYLRRYRRR